MKLNFGLGLAVLLLFSTLSGTKNSLANPQAMAEYKQTTADSICTKNWYRQVESRVFTSDEQGHGPDLGSSEWRSVVEFKLKIRGNPQIPARSSDSWCDYIDELYINPR